MDLPNKNKSRNKNNKIITKTIIKIFFLVGAVYLIIQNRVISHFLQCPKKIRAQFRNPQNTLKFLSKF